jgi:poly-gamma-glutamate biosynthesis protein PgsC/CapC
MLTMTLALGIAVSLVLTELTGLTAGGIIVPGYVALLLDRPSALGMLLAIAILTYLCLRILSQVLLLYGARRFGVAVLIGLACATGAELVPFGDVPLEWAGLGYIVPGLLAHQFDRQGILTTLLMVAIAAPIVRLLALGISRACG